MTPIPNNPQASGPELRVYELLARYRLLSEEQLAFLIGEELPQSRDLLLRKTIHTLQIPVLKGRERTVWALARRGAEALALAQGSEVNTVPYTIASRLTRSLFTLEHTLAVNQVGVVLEGLQTRLPDFRLRVWETTPQRIGTSILIREPGNHLRVPLVADAFFGLTWQREHPWFLVEMDRGTVSLKRMRLKFQGYLHWWKDNGPKKRFGVRDLRLLVLCPNERRLLRLRDAVRDGGVSFGRGFIWFAVQDVADLSRPERFLETHWRKASRPQLDYPLFRTCPEP